MAMTRNEDTNIYDALARAWRGRDDASWLVDEDGQSWSWRDVEATTARIAGCLAEFGLARGDRVAVQVDKSPQALLAWLGIARAGAVFVPINTASTGEEVSWYLADAAPTLAIGRGPRTPWFADRAREAGVAVVLDLGADGEGSWTAALSRAQARLTLLDPAGDAGDVATPAGRGAEPAAIVYTSGTTGRPKGAVLSHTNLIANAGTLARLWRMSSQDVLLHALPVFHVHGLFIALHTAMLAGAGMRLHRTFDAAAVAADLEHASVFMGVPTMYTRLLARTDFTARSCRGMRLFVSGSAPLLPETFRRFRQRTGHTILERYGMSETGMLTSNPCDGERRQGTVGPPLPDVEVRVVDGEDRPLPVGEAGDVQVRGPNVFSGYWRLPGRNAEEFTADGWFRTGDVGVFDADGYLELVGRSKDLIITGGYNVYPKEIELLLDARDDVAESAVVGVPHPDFGEAVVAVLTLGEGAAIDESSLREELKTRLAGYKVPKAVRVVEELPRNSMGKVRKNVLRDLFADLFVDREEVRKASRD